MHRGERKVPLPRMGQFPGKRFPAQGARAPRTHREEETMPKAADIMAKDVVTVTPATSLRELAQILAGKGYNGVPVVDDAGKVLGVVCESDLVKQNKPLHIPTVFVILDSFIPMENPFRLEKEFKRLTATTVEEIYSRPAYCISPDTDLAEIARIMSEKQYYTLPVVEGGRLVGVVGKSDLIRSMYE
jgi:CBS domain-containing protein